MIKARHSLYLPLLLALSLSLAACGGPSDPKTPADTPDPAPTKEMVSGGVEGRIALPAVPATPAEAPAELTAMMTAGNPNAQITQIGVFVDAVMPGMAAFVTPGALMQQVEGIVGVVGLAGIDLNQPLYLMMLGEEDAVIVAAVSSEAELMESLEGTSTLAMTHDGFAAIGKFDTLSKAGGYALSNLVKSKVPELPTIDLFMGKIMSGPQGDEVRKQIRSQMNDQGAGQGVDIVLTIMSNIDVLTLSFDTSAEGATIRLTGTGATGEVKDFIAQQKPSSFAMIDRVGTGPSAMAMGGRLDLTAFIPLLVKIGEEQGEPAFGLIAAQLSNLKEEVAATMNQLPTRRARVAAGVVDGSSLAQLVDTLLVMVAKQKLDSDGMKRRLKIGALKAKGGKLHELKLTPTTDELKKKFGKKGVSAFFGVVGNLVVGTIGPSAKKEARTLSQGGKLSGKGSEFAKAIAASKAAGESFLMAFDLMALQEERPAKDVTPIVFGLGFGSDSFTGRLVVPTDVVKEATTSM